MPRAGCACHKVLQSRHKHLSKHARQAHAPVQEKRHLKRQIGRIRCASLVKGAICVPVSDSCEALPTGANKGGKTDRELRPGNRIQLLSVYVDAFRRDSEADLVQEPLHPLSLHCKELLPHRPLLQIILLIHVCRPFI